MNGNKSVIDLLNKQLTLELTSMDQYLAHGKMFEDWGIKKLHEHEMHEHEEELGHAKRLAERILFLEGKADTVSREAIMVGSNTKEMLQNDLKAERVVADSLRKIIGVCEEEQDYVSRDILVDLLDDTEMDHIYWLEQQLGLIDKIGMQNYIQSHME